MSNNIVTYDFSEFGYREIKEASELLDAYVDPSKNDTEYLGDGIKVGFNKHSGCVFLTDEDYNTAMLNGDVLEDWLYCSECGHEGFKEDLLNDGDDCCKQFVEDLE